MDRRSIAMECADIITAYCHAIDRGGGAAVAALFDPGGVWISGPLTLSGPDAERRHLCNHRAGLVVRHVTGPTHVEVQDPSNATAMNYYVAYVAEVKPDARVPPLDQPFSLGEWHDQLVNTPNGWRIGRHEIERLMQRRAILTP